MMSVSLTASNLGNKKNKKNYQNNVYIVSIGEKDVNTQTIFVNLVSDG